MIYRLTPILTRSAEWGTNTDRQKANTKEEDPTGLLNEGHRYRCLETDVFISRDPAGFVDGPNLYTFVRQNPWTAWDPEGLQEGVVYPYSDPRLSSTSCVSPSVANAGNKDVADSMLFTMTLGMKAIDTTFAIGGGILAGGNRVAQAQYQMNPWTPIDDFLIPYRALESSPSISAADVIARTEAQLAFNDILTLTTVKTFDAQKGLSARDVEFAPQTGAKDTAARSFYMGQTPGKSSRTGKEVIKRMTNEGEVRVVGGKTEILNSKGKWVPVETTDMSHVIDAVTAWNQDFKYLGAKSADVRSWMLDPKSYRLDSSSINRSEGAKLKERYDPPVPYRRPE